MSEYVVQLTEEQASHLAYCVRESVVRYRNCVNYESTDSFARHNV